MSTLATLALLVLPQTAQLQAPVELRKEPSVLRPAELLAAGNPEPRTPIDATHTPGDADSVYRIAQPGSYYLPGDFRGQAGKAGIEIAASNVTIDLMGFTLLGKPTSLDGIAMDGARERITIRNGRIDGFGGQGVALYQAQAVRIEDVTASMNGEEGLAVGTGSHLLRCTVKGNGENGVSCYQNTVVADCIALENGLTGIWTSILCRVDGCESSQNGNAGISVASGSSVLDSRANYNVSHGISLGSDAEAHRCVANGNQANGIHASVSQVEDCVSASNAGYGIRIHSWSVVRGNRMRDNGSAGVGGGLQVEGLYNLVEDNAALNHDFAGYRVEAANNTLRRNVAADNGLNWWVVANNACRVLVATKGAGFFGDSGGVAMGPSDPNANYTY